MAENNFERNPEKARALERFRRFETDTFAIETDQKAAGDQWQHLSDSRKALKHASAWQYERERQSTVILPAGTVVQRGEVFQRILKPYRVKVSGIDSDGRGISENLPDNSFLRFSATLLPRERLPE
ncbi:MAG: hypothetical protein ABH867_03850 [Patescibacteria group bacterium]